MFKRFIPAILIFFALITLVQPAFPYYFKHEEGWWWYKEVVKRPEKKEEKVKAKIKEKEKVKISKERLLKDLDKIPVKELRKRADIAIELALDNPTLENVRTYLTIRCKPDNGMARRLNIEYLPAIYLAIPPDTIFPVSFRLITADELKDRIYKILNSEDLRAIRERQKASTPAGL